PPPPHLPLLPLPYTTLFRSLQPPPRSARRRARRQAVHTARPPPRGTGPLRHLRLAPERGRRDGLRLRLVPRHAGGALLLGGAVRRLRQRRAGGDRPVHLLGRRQVEPPLRHRPAPAPRVRGAGSGAQLGAAGALPPALRRGQHPGLLPDDAGAGLPPAPPAGPAPVAQAAGGDDAEELAAAPARGLVAA